MFDCNPNYLYLVSFVVFNSIIIPRQITESTLDQNLEYPLLPVDTDTNKVTRKLKKKKEKKVV